MEGDKVTRERFCPRCGPGIFLMKSQGRVYCGKCHYSEFEGKKAEETKTGSKAEEPTKKKE